MDTRPYNDYVLDESVKAGWISDEQAQLVRQALGQMPHLSALDLMSEQGILPAERTATFLKLIADATGTHGTAPAPESTPVPAGTKVAVQTHGFHEPHDPGLDHGGADIQSFLRHAVEVEASDLHLGPDFPPLLRYNGQLVPIAPDAEPLSPALTERLARQFLTAEQQHQVEEGGAVDFCYEAPGLARFRTSVVRQRRGWESVFRVINSRVRTMAELGLPPVLYELIKYHNGLILVTGSVGSGKTTTMAAMINQINGERRDHIITLEDPIEYVFSSQGCQITQREVHTHTESFATALRASLREDPDVIMVGEMRDLETISLAITASETGHLVLATLHTSSAARTMQRLLDVFPVEQQAQIRTMVSESIRGVVCQQLVPRADGKGRVMAMEIMVNNPAVANLIREGNNHLLPGQIQIGKKQGMSLMDDSLLDLVQKKLITKEEAYQRSSNQKTMAASLAGV
ncbi:MAG: type IV pilus twitching motility protein PilT [Candidatus Methylacidiphilales bacterium]|nr:type IV pilus twitching motility protein PilT [Candidatus Methylacidiphilales bacterium]